MWWLLRIALMWLLTFAVPAQGFAAASMFNCGPGHHGKAPSAQLVSHAAYAHDHAAGKAPAHHHDSLVAPHAHEDDATSAASGKTVAADGKALEGSCSACASCCTAAALPSAVVTFDATPVHGFIAPLAPASVAAFLTAGLERPPRPFLA